MSYEWTFKSQDVAIANQAWQLNGFFYCKTCWVVVCLSHTATDNSFVFQTASLKSVSEGGEHISEELVIDKELSNV